MLNYERTDEELIKQFQDGKYLETFSNAIR